VSALAIAGRLAFTAVPNVSPTYAVVFLGGILFGPVVGLAAGAIAMALTDLVLTGLLPAPYANVPAMAMLGIIGGLLRRLDWEGRSRVDAWASRVLAGGVGFAATLLFSLASDAATWAIVPELRATPGALAVLALSGLAFNLIPAAANAIVFAAATPLAVRTWRRLGLTPASSGARTTP